MTELLSKRPLYEGFFDLFLVQMRAENGDVTTNHVLTVGDCVSVLPYDAFRKVAIVVTMPRGAVAMAGLPDMLEAIGGRRDSPEPRDCARREAFEEAGVVLHGLEHVGSIWPSMANSVKVIDYYLAPYSQADRRGPGGGLAEEHENIVVHEVPLGDLWKMFEENRLPDGKLVTLLMALRIRRPELFQS